MRPPVRVAHVITVGQIGGAQNSIFRLLATLDADLYQPVVLCPTPSPFADLLAEIDVPTIDLPLDERFSKLSRVHDSGTGVVAGAAATVAAFVAWRRVLCQVGPDIVHTHDVKAHAVAGLAARSLRVPVVWHFRDIPTPRYRRAYRLGSYALPEAVIAISQAVADAHRFSSRKTVVVHNGVDLEAYVPTRGPVAELPWGADNPVVGTVGHTTPVKGLDVFLDAAAVIAESRPEARFVVVGGPIYATGAGGRETFGDLKRRAALLGLGERIVFTGPVDDVRPYLRAMSVFMLCSRSEGFGLAAAEAMAMALPVVATRVGGIPEVVDEGVTGLLADSEAYDQLASHALALVRDPDAGARMGHYGRSRVERLFDIREHAGRVSAVYDSLRQRGRNQFKAQGPGSSDDVSAEGGTHVWYRRVRGIQRPRTDQPDERAVDPPRT